MVKTYATGLAVLTGLAIYNWRLYCEGFGCIGKGVLWFGWTCGFTVWLVFGLVLAFRQGGTAPARLWARRLLVLQALAGLVLAAYWMVWRSN